MIRDCGVGNFRLCIAMAMATRSTSSFAVIRPFTAQSLPKMGDISACLRRSTAHSLWFSSLHPLPISACLRRSTAHSLRFPSLHPLPALKKSRSKKIQSNEDEDDADDDALEALFSNLEKDLEKDKHSDDDFNYDITEQDVAKLEEEIDGLLPDGGINEKKVPNLENWQLRKLASALDVGRRKVKIKKLAEELGIEREEVLNLLQNPPPQLLLLTTVNTESSSEANAKTSEQSEDTSKPEIESTDNPANGTSKKDAKVPVYITQSMWHAKKRIKKVHVATLEKVYGRTRFPNDEMVNSIVHLTNLPRRAVLNWFYERRIQDAEAAKSNGSQH